MHNRSKTRRMSLFAVSAGMIALGVLAAPAANAQPTETMTPWPFTVNEVRLTCEPGQRVFVSTLAGARYAVNGTARGEAPLMRPIQAIIDVDPLIRRGLALCGSSGHGVVRLVAPPPTTYPSAVARPHKVEIHGRDLQATAYANAAINGRFPELTFMCTPGAAPMVLFDFVREPRTPPPLRGVFATISTPTGPRVRYEMSWGTDGDWTLRSGDTRALDRTLTRAILSAGSMTLEGDGQYIRRPSIVWSMTGFGGDLRRFRSACLRP